MENDFDVVVISVKREVKEAVKDNLKVIMTEAVDKIKSILTKRRRSLQMS